MAVELPEPLQWVLMLLAGSRWPEGDEDLMRDMARRWRSAAETIDEGGRAADSAMKRALDGQQGAAMDELSKKWETLTLPADGKKPGFFPGMVKACNSMADSLEAMANSTETAKISIVAQLGILAYEIATAEAAAPVTAGASLAAIPAAITASKLTVQQILKKLAKEIIILALKEAFQEVAINLLAQSIQLAAGNRKELDGKELGMSAAGGAIGGAAGGVLGKGLGAAGNKLIGKNMDRLPAQMVEGAITDVGADAFTQFALTGEVDAGQLGGSALSGGAGPAIHRGAGALKGKFNSSDIPNASDFTGGGADGSGVDASSMGGSGNTGSNGSSTNGNGSSNSGTSGNGSSDSSGSNGQQGSDSGASGKPDGGNSKPDTSAAPKPENLSPMGSDGHRIRQPYAEGADPDAGSKPDNLSPMGSDGHHIRQPYAEGADPDAGSKPDNLSPMGSDGHHIRQPYAEGTDPDAGSKPDNLSPIGSDGHHIRGGVDGSDRSDVGPVSRGIPDDAPRTFSTTNHSTTTAPTPDTTPYQGPSTTPRHEAAPQLAPYEPPTQRSAPDHTPTPTATHDSSPTPTPRNTSPDAPPAGVPHQRQAAESDQSDQQTGTRVAGMGSLGPRTAPSTPGSASSSTTDFTTPPVAADTPPQSVAPSPVPPTTANNSGSSASRPGTPQPASAPPSRPTTPVPPTASDTVVPPVNLTGAGSHTTTDVEPDSPTTPSTVQSDTELEAEQQPEQESQLVYHPDEVVTFELTPDQELFHGTTHQKAEGYRQGTFPTSDDSPAENKDWAGFYLTNQPAVAHGYMGKADPRNPDGVMLKLSVTPYPEGQAPITVVKLPAEKWGGEHSEQQKADAIRDYLTGQGNLRVPFTPDGRLMDELGANNIVLMGEARPPGEELRNQLENEQLSADERAKLEENEVVVPWPLAPRFGIAHNTPQPQFDGSNWRPVPADEAGIAGAAEFMDGAEYRVEQERRQAEKEEAERRQKEQEAAERERAQQAAAAREAEQEAARRLAADNRPPTPPGEKKSSALFDSDSDMVMTMDSSDDESTRSGASTPRPPGQDRSDSDSDSDGGRPPSPDGDVRARGRIEPDARSATPDRSDTDPGGHSDADVDTDTDTDTAPRRQQPSDAPSDRRDTEAPPRSEVSHPSDDVSSHLRPDDTRATPVPPRSVDGPSTRDGQDGSPAPRPQNGAEHSTPDARTDLSGAAPISFGPVRTPANRQSTPGDDQPGQVPYTAPTTVPPAAAPHLASATTPHGDRSVASTVPRSADGAGDPERQDSRSTGGRTAPSTPGAFLGNLFGQSSTAPALTNVDTVATSEFKQDPAVFLESNYVMTDFHTALMATSNWDQHKAARFLKWMSQNSHEPHQFVLVKVPNGKLTKPQGNTPGESLMLVPDIRVYGDTPDGFRMPTGFGSDVITAPFVPYQYGPAKVRPKRDADGVLMTDGQGRPVMEPVPVDYAGEEVAEWEPGSTTITPSIGTTQFPAVPVDPGNPSFVFTPGMNGCALVVSPSHIEGNLTGWHFQSPNQGVNQTNSNVLRNSTETFWFGFDSYYNGPQANHFEVSQFLVWNPQEATWKVHSQPAEAEQYGGVLRPQQFQAVPVALVPGPNPTPPPVQAPAPAANPAPDQGPVPHPEPTGAPEAPTTDQSGADHDAPVSAPQQGPESDAPPAQDATHESGDGSPQGRYRPASGDRPQGPPGGLDDPSDADTKRINDAVPKDEETGRPEVHPDPNKGNWTAALNGDGFHTPGRNNNCVDVALSTVDTYSGHPTAAASRTPDADGRHSDQGERNGRERIENALGANFTDLGDGPEAFQRLEAGLVESGHGSQAVIITSDAEGRSHAWNAVNHDGVITYIDGQTGKRGDKPLHSGDNGVFVVPLDPDRKPTTPAPHPGSANSRSIPDGPGTADVPMAEPDENGPPAAGQPDVTRPRPYEQTKEEYLAGGGKPLLYRAIRIESQIKAGGVATADGELGDKELYQKLATWPAQSNIAPGDINAEVTVGHHVGGANYRSQYISLTSSLDTALGYSHKDFKAGPSYNSDFTEKNLPLRRWAPVIEVDVNQLNAGNRLADLSRPEIRQHTNLSGGNSEVEGMAVLDQEVLITGEIPGAAVVGVHGVEKRLSEMSDAKKMEFIAHLGPRPLPDDPRRAEWDKAYQKAVPQWFAHHFERLIVNEQPVAESSYVSAAQRKAEAAAAAENQKRRREAEAAEAQAAAAAAPKSKKKKKPDPTSMLSFDLE